MNGATVHPREVVKLGAEKKCCSGDCCPQPPVGNAEPSQADIDITRRLKQALN